MYRHILSLLILAMLSVACVDESGMDEYDVSDSCRIVIPFSIDNSSKTRSGEQVFDEIIDHVYLLFFSDLNAKPDAVVQVKVEDSEELSFYLPSELKSGTTYTLVAIANADDYVPNGFEKFSEYVKSVSGLSEICLFRSGSIVSSFASVSTTEPTYSQVCGVPMKATDNSFSFIRTNGGISITKSDKLLFYRLVSRVDVINSANNVIIEGVAMCNWRDSGYIVDSATLPGNICGVLTDEGGNTTNSLQFVSPINDDAGSQNLIGALYCFPSAVETSVKGDENTTALIIKARYNGEDTSCYYRVNLGVKEDSSELKANTKYTVNIKDVNGKGYPTPEEAYAATTEPSTEPTIPEGMDFALIPLSTDRVKVDHNTRTIEIDAFDPDCFNSFIDIPFKIYLNEDVYKSVTVSNDNTTNENRNTLEWPLIGRFSVEESKDYYYCPNSFASDANKAAVYSKSQGKEVILPYFSPEIKAVNNTEFFISVGAVAPDDPALNKVIRFCVYVDENPKPNDFPNITVNYTLIIKPREAIIDDVVLTDNNDYWLIMDRNVQKTSGLAPEILKLIGRDENGKKRQAYNCTNAFPIMYIPSKFESNGTKMNEGKHDLYKGNAIKNGSLTSVNKAANDWLEKYFYASSITDDSKTSPFYESENSNLWELPNSDVLELCRKKMMVSKQRMYLVSDIPVRLGNKEIPVCCNFPFYSPMRSMGETSSNTYGYYVSESSKISIRLVYCDKIETKQFAPTSLTSFYGMTRLVRSLTSEELDDYKVNYLGYGSTPCKLSPCHPDSYESTSLGWSPY